jgi:hypothetical protein
MPHMTNPANLPSMFCMQHVSFLIISTEYFLIRHKIDPNCILHPHQAINFKTSKVFLIYSPNCPKFSSIQSYAPSVNISPASSLNLLIAEINEIFSDKANQKYFASMPMLCLLKCMPLISDIIPQSSY